MQSFSNTLKIWKQKASKYFFSYRNGFFELYQFANSPQLMLGNFADMPFVKFDERYQTITTQNPFLQVKIFYLPFEEGLLLMLSEAFYKKNVMDNMLYDKNLPSEYFFISLKVTGKKLESKNPLINGTSYSHNTWSICKPAGIKNICHFKNSHEQFYTLFFTKTWLENYLNHADLKVKEFITDFLKSDTSYMMWPRLENLDKTEYALFKDAIENSKPIEEINYEVFRIQSINMFDDFISSLAKVGFKSDHLKMSNELRLKILKAENYLTNFYNTDFPGIEHIANKVDTSPTGLKKGFNQLFGCSIYKYFRIQKMNIACSVLEQNKSIKIKDLATYMGYENAAKFSAAFKGEIGILPSEAYNR